MSVSMTELCEVMNNWFDTKSDGTKDRHFGIFTIENNSIDLTEIGIKPGQYYRIVGSTFNDGVWQYPYPPTEEPETVPATDDSQDDADTTDTTDVTDTTDNATDVTDSANTDDTGDGIDNTPDTENTQDGQSTDVTEDTDSDDEEKLVDEVFDGAIWLMHVPPRVQKLLVEINDWNDLYGPIVDSPFNSETFGGYSYYKGYKNTMSNITTSWASKFAEQINRWRKVRRLV